MSIDGIKLPPVEERTDNNEAYVLAAASHPEDLQRWQEQTLRLEKLILKAKSKILDSWKEKTVEYLDSDEHKVTGEVQRLTDVEFKSGADMVVELISKATVDDVKIMGQSVVVIKDGNYGRVSKYDNLNQYEVLALEIVALMESLKVLPYQTPEKDLCRGVNPDILQRWMEEDASARTRWLADRGRLEELLKQFEAINISSNGTATPSYLKEVK